MTNADKIRNMTNDELGDFICGIADCRSCPFNCKAEESRSNWLTAEAQTKDEEVKK